MKDKLNEYDKQPLPSVTVIRWQNTAQWARNSMVKDGLLKSDSEYGIWEISVEGMEFLKKSS